MTSPLKSTCNLPWCNSSHNPVTHPVSRSPETGMLTHQEFKIASLRYRMQQQMLEAYREEGLTGPTFAFYHDYFQKMNWQAPDLREGIPQKPRQV